MKALMRFLLALIAVSASSQSITNLTNGTATSAGVAGTLSTVNGPTFYQAYFVVTGAPASFSVQLETSVNNGTSYSICSGGGPSTIQTMSELSCSGIFDHVRLNITALSAGASVIWSMSTWYGPFQTPVNITNSPSVTLSGTPNVNVTNTPSVTVSGTPSVSVSNTPNVSVTNTPSVTISGTPSVSVTNFPAATVYADPCKDPAILQTNVAFTAPATATTQIVAAPGAGKVIYPCGYNVGPAGAAGTFTFVTGTGANCATGQTALTNSLATTIGNPITYGPGATVLTVPTNQAVCATTTGLLATAGGVFSYVAK